MFDQRCIIFALARRRAHMPIARGSEVLLPVHLTNIKLRKIHAADNVSMPSI
jgi:hypothetical protein